MTVDLTPDEANLIRNLMAVVQVAPAKDETAESTCRLVRSILAKIDAPPTPFGPPASPKKKSKRLERK